MKYFILFTVLFFSGQICFSQENNQDKEKESYKYNTIEIVAGVFERENERLTLRVREPTKNTPVRVEFELVVKLASSRLPE